jgi:hypothetical protein
MTWRSIIRHISVIFVTLIFWWYISIHSSLYF